MKQTQATRRLGEQLREKLGYILLFEVSDPRLDLVTLTAVEVAVDRSFARVYVSCDASRYDEVMEALASAKGRIRSLLAARSIGASRRARFSASIARPMRPSASRARWKTFPPRLRSKRTRTAIQLRMPPRRQL